MRDWFESKTPTGALACPHCPQHFTRAVRHTDHVLNDHRVATVPGTPLQRITSNPPVLRLVK